MIGRYPTPAGVLFDAGGTLVQVHTERLAEALRSRGHDPHELDAAFWRTLALADHEFSPSAGVFEDWFPRWLDSIARHANIPSEVMAEAWDEADDPHHLWDQPIPGAVECLQTLRGAGVRVGVVSNSGGQVAQALERAGLADLLEVIVDSTVVGVHKPDPAIFDHALEPLELRADQTWYIGDTITYDMAAADAAGLLGWVIDHRGLHTLHHPRRVTSLDQFTEIVLAGRFDPA